MTLVTRMTLAPISSLSASSQQTTVLGGSINGTLPLLGVVPPIMPQKLPETNGLLTQDRFQSLEASLSETPLISSVKSPLWPWLKAHKQQLKQTGTILAGIGLAGLTAIAGHRVFRAFRHVPEETIHGIESFVEAPAVSYVPPLESIEDFVAPEWLGDYRQRWAKGQELVDHTFEDIWKIRDIPYYDKMSQILTEGLAHIGLPQCSGILSYPGLREGYFPNFRVKEGQLTLGSIGILRRPDLPENAEKQLCRETLIHELNHMISNLALPNRRDLKTGYILLPGEDWPPFIPKPHHEKSLFLFEKYLFQQPSFMEFLKTNHLPLKEEEISIRNLLNQFPEFVQLTASLLRKAYQEADSLTGLLSIRKLDIKRPLNDRQKQSLLNKLDGYALNELEADLSIFMGRQPGGNNTGLTQHQLLDAISALGQRQVAQVIIRSLANNGIQIQEADYPILKENPFV